MLKASGLVGLELDPARAFAKPNLIQQLGEDCAATFEQAQAIPSGRDI